MAEFRDKPLPLVVEMDPSSIHLFRGPILVGTLWGERNVRSFGEIVNNSKEAIQKRQIEADIHLVNGKSTFEPEFRQELRPNMTFQELNWAVQLENIVFAGEPASPPIDHTSTDYLARQLESWNQGNLVLEETAKRAFLDSMSGVGVFTIDRDQYQFLEILGNNPGDVATTDILSVFRSDDPTKDLYPELYVAEIAAGFINDYRFGDALRARSLGGRTVSYRLRLNTTIVQ